MWPKKFSALFADIIAQQQAFIFQIQNLRRTRDLLLPRLLSGQVESEIKLNRKSSNSKPHENKI